MLSRSTCQGPLEGLRVNNMPAQTLAALAARGAGPMGAAKWYIGVGGRSDVGVRAMGWEGAA